VRTFLLGNLKPDYFHWEPCKAAFERIASVARKRAVILGYLELLEDPALNEEYRELLSDEEPAVCKSRLSAERLLSNLDNYRKARVLYYSAKETIEALKADSVDLDGLLNKVTEDVTLARTSNVLQDLVQHVGEGANAISLMEDALNEEQESLLLTGFDEYDRECGGLPSQGVALLAATTSGGKSTLLMNLLDNLYHLNQISVANISLEMNKNKLARRTASMKTGIEFWKYTKKKLTRDEYIASKKAWRRIHEFGEKHGIKYAFIDPQGAISMSQALTLVKPFKFKAIGLDYVSLLEMDEKDQWKALSAVVREAKIFSEAEGCLVIILCQLDSEDDRIRYSKGMLEHADVAWLWNYSKPEQRETHRIPMRQAKGRDSILLQWELEEAFEVMQIRNPAQSEGATTSKVGADELGINDDIPLDYDAGSK